MNKCTKYTNPHKTTFITCCEINNKPYSGSYFLVLDSWQGYPEDINYCPNCGSKLTAMGYVNKNGKEVWCELDD